jgi:hypothetical protein
VLRGHLPKDRVERRYTRQRCKAERSFAWANRFRRWNRLLEHGQKTYRTLIRVFFIKYYLDLLYYPFSSFETASIVFLCRPSRSCASWLPHLAMYAERDALATVVEELNGGIAADRGLRLELGRWETDAYPGFHPEGPQGLIDSILKIEDCDVLIGIFWKRFGTPVKDAKSGTEHEFLHTYEAWQAQGRPQIIVYFNQKSYTSKFKAETDQWGQVLEFQKRFPKEGLWWPYKGKPQFERLVRGHLTNFIRHNAMKNPDGQPAVDSFVNGVIEKGLSQSLKGCRSV